MNIWQLAAVILGAAMVPVLGLGVLAGPLDALAAVEVAGALVSSVLMLLAEGFQRQPFIDLAVTFALVSAVGALAFARLMERQL
ncbi:MAG: hypothetical protein J2O48_09520 [Solirubrobacterales bacterium]|nr:hypothetical protein [Solirubrobacterales bacterium]